MFPDSFRALSRNTEGDPARGQTALRIRRSHCSQNNRHPQKSLRWSLYRHEFQTSGGDLNYAWPSAEIAVMGPSGAIEVLYGKEMADADDPALFVEQRKKNIVKNSQIHMRQRVMVILTTLLNPGTHVSGSSVRCNCWRPRNKVCLPKHDNLPL